MAAEERQRFIGRYTVAAAAGSTRPAMSLRVFEEKGALAGQIDGNVPTRLLYQGGNVFRPEQAPAFVVTFTVDGGRATRVSMVSPEGALSGARVEEGSGGHVTPADPATSGPLYEELARMDSLLFDAGFVTCDAAKANAMLTEDVEFYHDQTGFESGQQVRETFQRLTGSCPGKRGIRRELVTGSLQVYPMKGYGAVQMGVHRFVERGAPTMTVAKFVHLWRKTNGEWKLSRVLSFDHQPASSTLAP